MQLLVALARRAGETVDRESLIDEVWDGRVVSDESLFRCVADLRKKLGDSSSAPKYVQTRPKRGYRLLATVKPLPAEGVSVPVAGQRQSEVDSWRDEIEFDELKIVSFLAEGSMALLHLARDLALQRLVVIKTLRPELATDAVRRRRFHREALAAARISHPNVVAVYRVGELPVVGPYIVQQYIEGRSLEETLEIEGMITGERARAILHGVVLALCAAHDKRIIHRDLRPSNIMIAGDSGHAYLADFGIAGIQETGYGDVTRLTQVGEILGDPNYLSPEQVQGESATPQSDIYSFGILAYRLLTGRKSPYGEDLDPIVAHVKATATPAADANPALEPDYARTVDRCLSKNPRHRPTCHELAELLQAPGKTDDKDSKSVVSVRSTMTALQWGALALVAIGLVLLVTAIL